MWLWEWRAKYICCYNSDISLCDICQHYAHIECLESLEQDNPKRRKIQTLCKQCFIHKNQERFQYNVSKVIEGIVDDKNATKMTVFGLELG